MNLFRYASKESSDDAAYETYLKDYAGSAKGQDGEKYMPGSEGSSVPDYQHFADKYASNDQSRAATSHDHSQGPSEQMSYQKYAAGGGSSSWDEQYGWGA